MRSSTAQTALKVSGALVIVLTSFFITLKVLDHWGMSEVGRNSPGKIVVRYATYGANCRAQPGNATVNVQGACDGKTNCDYEVSVGKLGDPAGGCGKDFAVEYECGANSTARTENVPAEANGHTVHLSCP